MLRLLAFAWIAMAPAVPAAHRDELRIETSEPVVLARLPRSVLALCFAPGGRVLVLDDSGASLWRISGTSLTRDASWSPPSPPPDRVRRPGGLIRGSAAAPDFWVVRSGWTEAQLLTIEDDPGGTRLAATSTAAAVPWPGARNGLRFRAGTNLIDGAFEGLGPSPYLAVDLDGTVAVDDDGHLRTSGAGETERPRVGSAVVRAWPDVAVASSATTEGRDALLAITLAAPSKTAALASIDGAIRALAVLSHGDTATVLAAVDTEDSHLVLMLELRRRKGRP